MSESFSPSIQFLQGEAYFAYKDHRFYEVFCHRKYLSPTFLLSLKGIYNAKYYSMYRFILIVS